MINGCLQLKQAFLSEINGFVIEHLAHVGKMESLSLNGFDLIVKDPNSISYCHFGLTTNCANLS
jgi:hypothetical protein